MKLILNGKEQEVATGNEGGLSLSALLDELDLGERPVLVERNGEPVLAGHFSETLLDNGDRLEIVRMVAGG